MSQITEDAWAIFIGKVNRSSQDLRDAYQDLQDLTTPRRGSGGGPSAPDPFPQAPINIDILDLIQEIDRESDRLRVVVREALRMRPTMNVMPRVYLTVSNLEFVTKAVPTLWRDARAIAEDVVDTLWMLAGSVRRYTAPKASYLTVKACGECGECAVMVDPNHGRARCAACGHLTLAVDAIRP